MLVLHSKPDFDDVLKDMIIADDWGLVAPGYCKRCKSRIKHYKRQHVGAYTFVDTIKCVFDEESGYCEECAKFKAEEFSKQAGYKEPRIKARYQDSFGTEHTIYEDGSESELIGAGDPRYNFFMQGD